MMDWKRRIKKRKGERQEYVDRPQGRRKKHKRMKKTEAVGKKGGRERRKEGQKVAKGREGR